MKIVTLDGQNSCEEVVSPQEEVVEEDLALAFSVIDTIETLLCSTKDKLASLPSVEACWEIKTSHPVHYQWSSGQQ